VQSALGDGLTYGIGMPIVITLDHGVSKADEAKIQKRLTVVSTPSQTGSWYWMSDKEIHFRPRRTGSRARNCTLPYRQVGFRSAMATTAGMT